MFLKICLLTEIMTRQCIGQLDLLLTVGITKQENIIQLHEN